MCSQQLNDLSEIAFHEKTVHDDCSMFLDWMKEKFLSTNVVYGNGLVFNAYNLLDTMYDKSNLLDVLTERYLNVSVFTRKAIG